MLSSEEDQNQTARWFTQTAESREEGDINKKGEENNSDKSTRKNKGKTTNLK